jgi:hypothetical protein
MIEASHDAGLPTRGLNQILVNRITAAIVIEFLASMLAFSSIECIRSAESLKMRQELKSVPIKLGKESLTLVLEDARIDEAIVKCAVGLIKLFIP